MKITENHYNKFIPKIEIPEGFFLIQDTREQKALFRSTKWILKSGLKTGDYSILGMETMFTIERKNLSDLFGSLGQNRKRFEKEITRAKGMMWKGLLIEGSEKATLSPQDHSMIHPNAVFHSLSSISLYGWHIYYALKPIDARNWVLSRATRFYNMIREGKLP